MTSEQASNLLDAAVNVTRYIADFENMTDSAAAAMRALYTAIDSAEECAHPWGEDYRCGVCGQHEDDWVASAKEATT